MRLIELRETGYVRQWHAFDAFVFWDDITCLVEDRTGTSDPPPSMGLDKWARISYPGKVENNFVWLMVIAQYQETRSLAFIRGLAGLTHGSEEQLDAALRLAEKFVKFRNIYRHRAITTSEEGKAVYEALIRMFGLDNLAEGIGGEIQRAQAHYESKLAFNAKRSAARIQFALTTLTFFGIPFGVISAAVVPWISPAFSKFLPFEATLFLIILVLLYVLVVGFVLGYRKVVKGVPGGRERTGPKLPRN